MPSTSNSEPPAVYPASHYFPSWSKRRIADNARAGRIPARKIGRDWMIASPDFERWRAGERLDVITVEDAAEDLRRRGIIQ